MVIEVFGFSPRALVPDVHVYTYSNRLRDRDPVDRYVNPRAHANYLVNNPNNDSRFFSPFDYEPFLQVIDADCVAEQAREDADLPGDARHSAAAQDPDRTCIF